ncbi:MAG: hypothetical protein QME06_03535 [Desulfobacterales bacterium]|nr:hypothetical protein [Desulfobacterales bacterium]
MEFILSIAKTSIAVTLEKSLEQTGADLKKLYTGFLSNHQKTDAYIRVSCDNLTTYCESKDGPIRLPVTFKSQNYGFSVASVYKFLFLYISLILAEQKKLLIHGAGIKKKDGGYLFLGESGAGKTTIAGSAKRDDIFSDDSPVIGREDNFFCIYPSPYSQVDMFGPKREDHYLKKTELTKLFFLKKNDKLFIKPRNRKSALAEIIKKHIHSFEFMGSKSRIAAFDLCYDLCSSIPIYDLHFQKNDKFQDII